MTVALKLAVEKFREAQGGSIHAEFSKALQHELRTQSISAWRTVFEDIYIVKNLLDPYVYYIFSFKELQNIYLGWSKLSKNYYIFYTGSDRV